MVRFKNIAAVTPNSASMKNGAGRTVAPSGVLPNSHNTASVAAPGTEPRLHAGQLDPDYRRTNFEEVDDVYTPSEAVREASRCLRCYRIALAAH